MDKSLKHSSYVPELSKGRRQSTGGQSNTLVIPQLLHHRKSAGFDLDVTELYPNRDFVLNSTQYKKMGQSWMSKARQSSKKYLPIRAEELEKNSNSSQTFFGCEGNFSPRLDFEDYFIKINKL